MALDRRRNALEILLLLATVGALLFRIAVTPRFMNMVMPYTSEGGPFYAKFHLGTYLVGLALALVLCARKVELRGDDAGLFRFLVRHGLMLAALIVYIVLISRIAATGFIVDTYGLAWLGAMLLLVQGPAGRRAAGACLLGLMILSAAIGVGEFVTRHRLIPFSESEAFRATGLAGHPLSLGAQCVVAIGFTMMLRWPLWMRLSAVGVLLLGCVASGARTALMLSVVEIVLLLLYMRWPKLTVRQERRAKLFALLAAMVIGTVLAIGLLAGGMLTRFQNGLVDANFMARIDIYRTFTFVSWRDILFGMDARALLTIVNTKLHLPYIESAPVLIVLSAGLPAALFLTAIVVTFFARLLRGGDPAAKIAATLFLIADLSNNALATKTADVLLVTVLILAFRAAPATVMRPDRYGVPSMTSSRPARLRV